MATAMLISLALVIKNGQRPFTQKKLSNMFVVQFFSCPWVFYPLLVEIKRGEREYILNNEGDPKIK
jgi:hypothetical protein